MILWKMVSGAVVVVAVGAPEGEDLILSADTTFDHRVHHG
jgi:hypothetical protein